MNQLESAEPSDVEKKPNAEQDSGSPCVPFLHRLQHSVALPWILCGLLSYGVLSLICKRVFHNPLAEALLATEVSPEMHDRSTFIFLTAMSLDLLNVFFERNTVKLDFVLLPTFIKLVACTTNVIVQARFPVLCISHAGRLIIFQRYICWMHTSATMLLLLKLMSKTISLREFMVALMFDEIMMVTGALGLLTHGRLQVCLTIISHASLLPILVYMHKAFTGAQLNRRTSVRSTLIIIYSFTVTLWISFGVVWDIAVFDLVSSGTEEAMYLTLDFCAKVLFSSTLMLGSFKGLEQQRQDNMRLTELRNKQGMIEELKGVLARKERFMNSMSHELRTPLNGIIGISEGMLSGCCGILHEQVQHQIHIICTSGARLLSLIHDVMDAAVLNHKKLVLKSEQVMLRPLVEDVLDLTRSLVDSKVELRNSIPPGMSVSGDAGRIVQILNNLLGNAAKFTRKGHIRVSARLQEVGHMVAVTIADTGIGIARNKLDGIFRPFEQAGAAITIKYGGCGLGLNIVQELVNAHGGEIWVESQESVGSAFTFLLPMYQEPGSARSNVGHEELFDTSVRGRAGADVSRLLLTEGSGNLQSARRNTTAEILEGGLFSESVGSSSAGVRSIMGSLSRSAKSHRSINDWSTMHQGRGSGMTMPVVDYNSAELSALGNSTPFDDSHAFSMSSDVYGAGSVLASRHTSHARLPPSTELSLRMGQQPGRRHAHSIKHGRYLLLSVDDDAVNQSVVRSLLSSTNYEVVTVPSGGEAVSYLESCESLPDVILLDCMMPEMDGYQVLAQIRSMFTYTYIPVIMVSAQAEESHVVQGLDQGADDYVTKPFNRQELLARIKAQLGFEDDEEDESKEQGGCDSRLNQDKLILCVDDDEINQMILQGMLRSQLYRCVKAKTGSEGLAYISPTSIPPDLVLLDCSLPDMTGFDVCAVIRKVYSKLQVPIIMLSARHNEKSIVEGLQCGANDYVTKPFRRGELLARIRMALRSRNAAATEDARDNSEENGPTKHLSRAASLDFISTSKAEKALESACTLPALHASRGSQDYSELFNLHHLASHEHHSQSAPHPPITAPVITGSVKPAYAVGVSLSHRVVQEVGVLVAQVVESSRFSQEPPMSSGERAAIRRRFAEMFQSVETQHKLTHVPGVTAVGTGTELFCAMLYPQRGAPYGTGSALLPLHRAAIALLEGASWLALPGARNSSLMVRVAIHAGPVSGILGGMSTPDGCVKSHDELELLSGAGILLQWAPSMTVVCGEAVARQLRELGLVNMKELPLALLQPGSQPPDRRVWLVEAHALSNLSPPTPSSSRISHPSHRPTAPDHLYTTDWPHQPAHDASSSWVSSNQFAATGPALRVSQHLHHSHTSTGKEAPPYTPLYGAGWRQQGTSAAAAPAAVSRGSLDNQSTNAPSSAEEIHDLKRKVSSLKLQLDVMHSRGVVAASGSNISGTPSGTGQEEDGGAPKLAKRTLSRLFSLQSSKNKEM